MLKHVYGLLIAPPFPANFDIFAAEKRSNKMGTIKAEKMVSDKLKAFCCMAMLSLCASCAKEGPTGPMGPSGPDHTGIITGHVSLFDQYGSPVDTGLVRVALKLTSLSNLSIAAPNTTPDINGLYSYAYSATNNISTGAYSIAATDSAYGGTYTIVQLVSGVAYADLRLSQIPQFAAAAFTSARDASGANDSLTISFPPDSRTRNCIVFVNSVASVANNAYLASYQAAIPPNANTVVLIIPGQDLRNLGLHSGGYAYYASYSYVVNDASAYEDPSSGKKIFTAVSNPIIDSALVP